MILGYINKSDIIQHIYEGIQIICTSSFHGNTYFLLMFTFCLCRCDHMRKVTDFSSSPSYWMVDLHVWWLNLLISGVKTREHYRLDITSRILEANKGKIDVFVEECQCRGFTCSPYASIYHAVLLQESVMFWCKVTSLFQRRGMPWNAGATTANGGNPTMDWLKYLTASVIISVRAQGLIHENYSIKIA